MTDLEMTRLCAEVMGAMTTRYEGLHPAGVKVHGDYNPLEDDAQAMELLKRFKLELTPNRHHGGWWVSATRLKDANGNADLNRAIVECVAKMATDTASTHPASVDSPEAPA